MFTSKPLTKPVEVTGPMSATLWAASDAKDTDWIVMLLDVFPDGRAERVQDGIARARFRKGFERRCYSRRGASSGTTSICGSRRACSSRDIESG